MRFQSEQARAAGGQECSVKLPKNKQATIALRFFEIAFVPVYFDQFASRIVNTDHGIMWPDAKRDLRLPRVGAWSFRVWPATPRSCTGTSSTSCCGYNACSARSPCRSSRMAAILFAASVLCPIVFVPCRFLIRGWAPRHLCPLRVYNCHRHPAVRIRARQNSH